MVTGECIYHKDFKRPMRQLRPTSALSSTDPKQRNTSGGPPKGSGPLTVDDESKLVFGVVFSLRNMVKKLSGE